MKNRPGPVVSGLVSPPNDTLRDDVIERPVPSRLGNAPQHRPHDFKIHDKRTDIATEESGERIRARQTEPRTAVDCHVRVWRRPRPEPEK